MAKFGQEWPTEPSVPACAGVSDVWVVEVMVVWSTHIRLVTLGSLASGSVETMSDFQISMIGWVDGRLEAVTVPASGAE